MAEPIEAQGFQPTEHDNRHLFEIKDTLSKGKGVFAVQHIPRGTLILSETPLLQAPNRIAAAQAFLELSIPKQKAYLQLHGMLSVDSFVNEQISDLTCKIASIYQMNTFGDAVLELASRFNHSCIPNTQLANPADGTKTYEFFVIRDIVAGEELCVAYTHPFMTRAERQRSLQHWVFHCQCPACEDTDEGQQKEDKFAAMTALHHELDKESLTNMTYDEAVVVHTRKLPKLQKLTGLMRSLGLLSVDILKQ